jgi:hypothetical protein
MTGNPRIALIHALRHSVPTIMASFARLWPEARLANLLDDSLSADLARDRALTARMTEHFLTLSRYAANCGADAILFTCSAFGLCIETCAAALAPMPVLKPNEAMIEEVAKHVGAAGRIGLLASFAPTLASMGPEFHAALPRATLVQASSPAALAALDAGDPERHDEAAAGALPDCEVIAVPQFSLASAAARIAEATNLPVLTTPDGAVRKLRRMLG